MPDDRVPVVRFAPVRRRVPIRPDQGAAMTVTLIVIAVVWAGIVLIVLGLCRSAGDADRTLEEIRRKRRLESLERDRVNGFRRGPGGGWRY